MVHFKTNSICSFSLVCGLFLLLFVGISAFAQSPTPTPNVEDNVVIRVDTELINIPVTVTDKYGKPVPDLKRHNFVVLEDGKSQEISDFSSVNVPFEIMLLLDTSGSAREDLERIKQSAKVFLESLRPGDKLGIAAYTTVSDNGKVAASTEILSPVTNDRSKILAALERIATSNGTPYYDSLLEVTKRSFPDSSMDSQIRRRALVVLSDGVDSTSNIDFLSARNFILSRGIASFIIRVDTRPYFEENLLGDCSTAIRFSQAQIKRYYDSLSKNSRMERVTDQCKLGDFERLDISKRLYEIADAEMEHLAKITGGYVFPAESLTDARRAFDRVAETIGKTYTIGYYSTNNLKDGKFRKITVSIKGVEGDLVIRSREGYTAKPN